MWKANYGYFYMNAGAYPEENEVIISDGIEFEVIQIEKEQTQSGKSVNVITLRHKYYNN